MVIWRKSDGDSAPCLHWIEYQANSNICDTAVDNALGGQCETMYHTRYL